MGRSIMQIRYFPSKVSYNSRIYYDDMDAYFWSVAFEKDEFSQENEIFEITKFIKYSTEHFISRICCCTQYLCVL